MLPYLIAGVIGYGISKLFEHNKAPKYNDGGLIAPNGKPSNLTPEQYKLVRTPKFKAWFGDWENDPANASKVIDENGEPLVVFHGTNEQFNIFNKKGKGNRVLGYFFTTDKDFSKNYGESKLYFLNIKKIKNFNSERFDSLNTRENAENNYWQLEKDKLLEEMYNGVLIDRNDFFADINFVRKDYVAFEPNQIKLADGTNTTFDGSNPDIRFMAGGELTNNDVLKNFVNQVEAYQSNHYGTFNRDNLVESYHKLPDSIKEKIKPISTKNLFRGADGTSYKSAISFTKNQDYAKMFGAYAFPFNIVKENKGLIDTKRLSALLSKMRIANEIGDDEGEVIVIEPIFSKDIIKNIEKFRFDNGGLIAPNGKPSNLTPEQYKLVRTKEFKNWFGDWENDPENASKVVDENGEPKVVTHSTPNEDSEGNTYNYPPFNIFDGNRIFNTPNSSVIPIWFSYKGNYAVDKTILNMLFFLNIKKLFLFSNQNHLKQLQKYMIEKYENYDVDLEYDYNNNWEAIEDENLPAYISEIGFDGYKTDSENAIAIFKSEQGKLADGTNTTFDGKNPDIRFDGGGNIDDVLDKMLQGEELSQEDKNKMSLYQKHLLSGENDNTFEYHRVSELNIADTNSEEHINKSQIVVQFESDQKIDVKYMLKKIALTLKKSNIDSVVGFGFKMLAYIGYFVEVNEYDIEKAMSVLKNIGFNVTMNPYYNTLYFLNEVKDDIKFQKLSENPDIIILSNSEIYQKLNLTDAQSVTRLTKLLKNFGITSYFIMKNQLTITDKSKINDLINYLNSKGYNAIRFKKRR